MAAPPVPILAGETGPVAAADDLYPKAPEPDQEVTPAPVQVAASVEPVAAPSMHPTARWDGPLVGRDAQLADLRARFDRVVADGSPATVLITGEPGSGRTRLVTEFAASFDAANVLHVGCAPADGGGARWPLAGLVEALAGLHPLAPAEPARARLAALFEGQPDGDDVVPHLASMIALDGPSDPDHVRWALRRLIEVTAGGRPTIVHVDDADRAGAGFVRLLADVATATRGTPLFVVVTIHTRDRRSPRDPPAPASTARRPHLGRPTPRCLGGRRRRGASPRDAGLPACDRAVARDAHRKRHPRPGTGRWMPLADLTQRPVPDTTIGAIRQRLQTLPAHTLAVLGMAAVAGERFAAAPLLEVVPVDARPGVPGYLQIWRRAGTSSTETDGTYRFRHALLAGGHDRRGADWAQAVTHERFGRHLEATAGPRVWRRAEVIGAHLEASNRLRPDAPDADTTTRSSSSPGRRPRPSTAGDLDGAARLERRAAR